MNNNLSIALVHDDFMQWGGAERVVSRLAKLFPQAVIYTSMADEDVLQQAEISRERLFTSWLDKLPAKKSFNKAVFPLYPVVFEQFDFAGYDIVITSSTRFAHGIITAPQTKHISYMHSPFRGFWEPRAYFRNDLLRNLLNPLLMLLRGWDTVAGQRADKIYANSSIVKKRIEKYYRREAEVIYPFVDESRFAEEKKPSWFNDEQSGKYFILLGRLVKWKKPELAIEACLQENKELIVVGQGDYLDELKNKYAHKVRFTGFLDDAQTTYVLKRAQGLIHPQKEDFGMTVIEANACGVPVIAYDAGGTVDTVINKETGILFDKQEKDSVVSAIKEFSRVKFNVDKLKKHAQQFSRDIFDDQWRRIIKTS